LVSAVKGFKWWVCLFSQKVRQGSRWVGRFVGRRVRHAVSLLFVEGVEKISLETQNWRRRGGATGPRGDGPGAPGQGPVPRRGLRCPVLVVVGWQVQIVASRGSNSDVIYMYACMHVCSPAAHPRGLNCCTTVVVKDKSGEIVSFCNKTGHNDSAGSCRNFIATDFTPTSFWLHTILAQESE